MDNIFCVKCGDVMESVGISKNRIMFACEKCDTIEVAWIRRVTEEVE